MEKSEGDVYARFLTIIDSKWRAMHGYEDRYAAKYVGPREEAPPDDA